MKLEKYSFGVGDRFAHQAKAQLKAFEIASACGVDIVPVWNKSYREHTTIGSEPGSVRAAADKAARESGWTKSYYVDADHIRLETVGAIIESSDFYTIDVGDSIGLLSEPSVVDAFVDRHPELIGRLSVPGIETPFDTTRADVERVAANYLKSVRDAGAIYRVIRDAKGENAFITEVSMDETDQPQTPPELLVILAAVADEKIPVQTIAPKFSGRFNKGVDYVGDIDRFEKEFSDDLAVIAFAVRQYRLPENLKLSVHSGSDKFSIYAPIKRSLARFDAGLHIKTAGTTWLEELIGLAEAGGEGLDLAKEIYANALVQREVLCAPYASVIDIDASRLPPADVVKHWSAGQFAGAVRHDRSNASYNPNMRQLLHVGYKIAAQMGDRYLKMLDECEESVARNVTDNLFSRHIEPLFLQ